MRSSHRPGQGERPAPTRPAPAAGDAGESGELLYGVHPVEQALEYRPASVERVYACRGGAPARIGRVLREARVRGVPVTYLPPEVLARKLGARASHQGIAARVAPFAYTPVDELVRRAAAERPGRIVLLDGVVDPQNLGAALRTCAAAGVQGVVLASQASAGLTPAVARASAGAVERLGVGREPNLGRRLERLGTEGFSTVALVARGGEPWDAVGLGGRLALVAGGEQRGPRPGTLVACRRRVTVPVASGIDSLNVAVALGVVLFEAVRQARAGAGP